MKYQILGSNQTIIAGTSSMADNNHSVTNVPIFKQVTSVSCMLENNFLVVKSSASKLCTAVTDTSNGQF